MNDFLTRLAQRSIGVAPLITPRLPDLFAPFEESRIGNPAATTPVTSAMSYGATAPVAGAEQSATPAPIIATAITSRAQPTFLATPSSMTHGADNVDRVEPRVEQSETRVSLRSTQAASNLSRQAGEEKLPGHSRDFSTESNETESVPATSAKATFAMDSDRSASDSLLAPLKKMAARADTASPPLLPIAADIIGKPIGPRAARIGLHDDKATAAHTVHITIGRVEVRANIATPPAAPRPRPASQPALSLGDFLKRGAGAS
ncbi:MAG: hypothetical protein OEV15_06990 [Gallionella sp.]|nr:hypothetical protein [Gallionella sp.]